eukprot:3886887-Rhodomonas_salina.1
MSGTEIAYAAGRSCMSSPISIFRSVNCATKSNAVHCNVQRSPVQLARRLWCIAFIVGTGVWICTAMCVRHGVWCYPAHFPGTGARVQFGDEHFAFYETALKGTKVSPVPYELGTPSPSPYAQRGTEARMCYAVCGSQKGDAWCA